MSSISPRTDILRSFTASLLLSKLMLGYKGKGKGKVHTRTGHEGPEGEQFITLLFLQPRR